MEEQIAFLASRISRLEDQSGVARQAQEKQNGFSKKIHSYLWSKGLLGPDYQNYTGSA